MKQCQQTLGDDPGILVNKENSAQADQHHEKAFDQFEGSYHPQQASLRWVGTVYRCRREHAAARIFSEYHDCVGVHTRSSSSTLVTNRLPLALNSFSCEL